MKLRNLSALFTILMLGGQTGLRTVSAGPRQELDEWGASGRYRIRVVVEPVDLGGKESDERPAKLEIDFEAFLAEQGVSQLPDLSSIQVIRYDPATNQPMPYSKFRFAIGPCDLPYRFDEVDPRPFRNMYNLRGDGRRGTLVWTHVQERDQPSHYIIAFDTVRSGEHSGLPARAQIGDGDTLFQKKDGRLGAETHMDVAVIDWDGDGRLDLIVGDSLGYLRFYPNLGSKTRARFNAPDLIRLDNGELLKVTYSSHPCITDWDDDGDADIILGSEPEGKVFFYENVGSSGKPVLKAAERVTADAQPITTPPEPCPEWPGAFKRDYASSPEVVDWDGDGDKDLLLGGYLTGLIFYYENMRQARGIPQLSFRGRLQADGKDIDVQMVASPAAVDLDADEDLDLVSGCYKLSKEGGGTDKPGLTIFNYYENVGTRTKPLLEERSLPITEPSPGGEGMSGPAFADLDDDGDLDIVSGMTAGVGTNFHIKIFRNVGNDREPLFQREPPLTREWGPFNTSIFGTCPGDWDGDGDLDLIIGGTSHLIFAENIDPRNPPKFVRRGKVKVGGKVIEHVWPHGDSHTFPELFDWDQDGDLDLILGISMGDVFYYENVGDAREFRLAEGRKFMLTNGRPVHAGKIGLPEKVVTFAEHSGDRSVVGIADFDGDGNWDLIVSDANADLLYFENVGTNPQPVFSPGQVWITGKGGRAYVTAADWNGDGLPDVIYGRGWDHLFLNTGARNEPQFDFSDLRTHRLDMLPYIPYPFPYVFDWNGDGDKDLVINSSHDYLYFMDHSFWEHGYAEALLLRSSGK